MRKEPTRKASMGDTKTSPSNLLSPNKTSKIETSETKTTESLKKSRSMLSSITKPKQEPYPALPFTKMTGSAAIDSLPILPGLSGNGESRIVHPNKYLAENQRFDNVQPALEPSKLDINVQPRSSYLTVDGQESIGYDSIEEQLINIYGESKWLREESVPRALAEGTSGDTDRLKRADSALLCNSRPKVQYEHFLSSTLPLLHRFTYSQINTLSRRESELIKQFQAEGGASAIGVHQYANDLEPILRQKIGLLIVLYESVRDVVSSSREQELQDLECGEAHSFSMENNTLFF